MYAMRLNSHADPKDSMLGACILRSCMSGCYSLFVGCVIVDAVYIGDRGRDIERNRKVKRA